MYAEFSLPPEWRRCEEEHGADCKYSQPDPMTGSSRLRSSTAAVFTQIAEIGERERPILRNQPISILECFERSTSLGFALHVMTVPRLGHLLGPPRHAASSSHKNSVRQRAIQRRLKARANSSKKKFPVKVCWDSTERGRERKERKEQRKWRYNLVRYD